MNTNETLFDRRADYSAAKIYSTSF